jgi:hypothetical protein
MKNIKSLTDFLNEDFDPGTVQVPGDAYVTQVNSRNYQAAHQPLPQVLDPMYESSYFCEFLDECGKSENFDKFLKESKRSAVDIAGHIKENFLSKNTKDKSK